MGPTARRFPPNPSSPPFNLPPLPPAAPRLTPSSSTTTSLNTLVSTRPVALPALIAIPPTSLVSSIAVLVLTSVYYCYSKGTTLCLNKKELFQTYDHFSCSFLFFFCT